MNSLTRLLQAMTMAALLMPVMALADAVPDAKMDSLSSFFAKGIRHQGAVAELIEVRRWPDTEEKISWRLPQITRHTSNLSLIAEQGEGVQKKRWYVPVRVHWWADAVVVKKDAPLRTLLLNDMLEVKRIDVADHIGVWWKKTNDIEGMQVTRPLHKGDAVYSPYVKRPPLVKRGDLVTIVVTIGSISVRAEGKALKAGSRGDRLLVQNLRSKQMVQAVVMDANTVYVQTGGAG